MVWPWDLTWVELLLTHVPAFTPDDHLLVRADREAVPLLAQTGEPVPD